MCLAAKCVDCGHEELTANAECPCGCHFKVTESLLVKDGIVSSLQARITTLEADNATLREQLATAQREAEEARAWLAMAAEALREWLDLGNPLGLSTTSHRDRTRDTLTATAEAIAAFRQRVQAKAIQDIQRCVTPEHLAEIMHDTYERQALIEGWKTQESYRVPFADLPEANRRVMVAVAKAVLWATPDLSVMGARAKAEGAAEENHVR